MFCLSFCFLLALICLFSFFCFFPFIFFLFLFFLAFSSVKSYCGDWRPKNPQFHDVFSRFRRAAVDAFRVNVIHARFPVRAPILEIGRLENFAHLYLYPSIYPRVYPSTPLSSYLPIFRLSSFSCTDLAISVSICISFYRFFIRASFCPSLHSAYPLIHPFFNLSFYLTL